MQSSNGKTLLTRSPLTLRPIPDKSSREFAIGEFPCLGKFSVGLHPCYEFCTFSIWFTNNLFNGSIIGKDHRLFILKMKIQPFDRGFSIINIKDEYPPNSFT
ncbi:hypothetical protein A2U01_0040626, partial [Trifolium medium]|nr:hypothetical protein [Trifolium medium]